MGFVEKLWDETVAGPSPETFRKAQVELRTILTPPPPVVSRSITLLRTRSLPVAASASPSGSDPSSPISSPLTPGTPPSDELRRLSRTHTPTSFHPPIQDSDFTPPPSAYRF